MWPQGSDIITWPTYDDLLLLHGDEHSACYNEHEASWRISSWRIYWQISLRLSYTLPKPGMPHHAL